MCDHDVVVRPYRARQEGSADAYVGHDGIRDWVAGLDDGTKITIELHSIEITGPETALVDAGVWFERDGERSGGPTVSKWHFTMGKLDRAIGYANREDALLDHRDDGG
jgi:hypothetical protein